MGYRAEEEEVRGGGGKRGGGGERQGGEQRQEGRERGKEDRDRRRGDGRRKSERRRRYVQAAFTSSENRKWDTNCINSSRQADLIVRGC